MSRPTYIQYTLYTLVQPKSALATNRGASRNVVWQRVEIADSLVVCATVRSLYLGLRILEHRPRPHLRRRMPIERPVFIRSRAEPFSCRPHPFLIELPACRARVAELGGRAGSLDTLLEPTWQLLRALEGILRPLQVGKLLAFWGMAVMASYAPQCRQCAHGWRMAGMHARTWA